MTGEVVAAAGDTGDDPLEPSSNSSSESDYAFRPYCVGDGDGEREKRGRDGQREEDRVYQFSG